MQNIRLISFYCLIGTPKLLVEMVGKNAIFRIRITRATFEHTSWRYHRSNTSNQPFRVSYMKRLINSDLITIFVVRQSSFVIEMFAGMIVA